MDDGNYKTLEVHKGTELEAVFTTGANLTDPEYTIKPMSKFVLQMLKVHISLKVICLAKYCKSVIDEMISDVLKMKEMVTKGELLFPVINVNGYKMKFKFDNLYGCRSGARVCVTECVHICALQAGMDETQNNTTAITPASLMKKSTQRERLRGEGQVRQRVQLLS